MLRILHTSDWHAGKVLNKVPRREDLIYALEQIEGIVREEKVDCLVVAGDIFDRPNPSPTDQEIVWDFFLKMSELGVFSLVISGNHDSQDFLRSVHKLLKLANAYVLDRALSRNLMKEKMIIPFEKNGEKVLFVLLPYIPQRVFSDLDKTIREVDMAKDYSAKLSAYLEVLAKQTQEKMEEVGGGQSVFPVLISHMMVWGAKVGGTEKEISVQDYFSVKPERIPGIFRYCALGHIHRHQKIQSISSDIAYSGTIYQIDFGEEGQSKGVFLIDVENGRISNTKFVELSLKHPLKTYNVDIDSQAEQNIVDLLRKDKEYLKKVVINHGEGTKQTILSNIRDTIVKNVENVVYIEMMEKGRPKKKSSFSKLFGRDLKDSLGKGSSGVGEEAQVLRFYEIFFFELKKRKKSDWDKVFPKIREIMEKISD